MQSVMFADTIKSLLGLLNMTLFLLVMIGLNGSWQDFQFIRPDLYQAIQI